MRFSITLFLFLISLIACTKVPVAPTPDPEPKPNAKEPDDNKDDTPNASAEQLIADSIFLFSKEIYYWQENIGSETYKAFNPRQYVKSGDALATAQAVMASVRTYNTHDNEKHFSYAEDFNDGTSSERAATKETGYGFFVKSGLSGGSFKGWFVNYVFAESEAGIKGVERGMKLDKVNGVKLTSDNASINLLNNMLAYETITDVDAEFIRPDGSLLNIKLGINSYIPNSVLYSNVLTTTNGKKVGYLVYKFFDKLSESRSAIDNAIQSFTNQSVSSIIIDLRYNNGGYVETQDYLANKLAPRAVNGNLMYTFEYNDILKSGKYVVLQKRYPLNTFTEADFIVNFNTLNSLNTPKVYIIVGERTASASELLINNLKAVLDKNLVLIGDANTYGKPVGFFPIDLFKKVTFWTVSFMTKNSKKDAVSYDGFKPDYMIYDAVQKSWGDATEDCTAAALKLIDGGKINAQSTLNRSVSNSKVLKLIHKESLMNNMLYLK